VESLIATEQADAAAGVAMTHAAGLQQAPRCEISPWAVVTASTRCGEGCFTRFRANDSGGSYR
jgi:hypothetical protein